MLIYPVILTPDDNDTVMVTFPDFPEAITCGDTKDEALAWALDALETVLEAYIDDRKEIPRPTELINQDEYVVLPATTAGKVILHNSMLESGKRKADLARMMNLAPSLVDRLLSLRHKSKIEQIETALAVLGKKLVVDVI
ncbi:MAG: type II toxin-antitoxin system HicB family antitoxin [Desulfuromonadales bacterium]|nr:type II toxin-antitoxin system HicB family antitoxin [Desulfuromonadales bacterium]